MTWSTARRPSAFLLVLVLTLGVLAHGVQAADMGIRMAAVAAGAATMPDGCDGCGSGDDNEKSPAACLALCGSLIGILPGPVDIEQAIPATLFEIAIVNIATRCGPPDPRPPKAAVLS